MTAACPTCGNDLPDNGTVVVLEKNTVVIDGETIPLTAGEAELLFSLVEIAPRTGRVGFLRQRVSGARIDPVSDETIKVLVCRIRKKIQGRACAIETVWGVGYRFARLTEARAA